MAEFVSGAGEHIGERGLTSGLGARADLWVSLRMLRELCFCDGSLGSHMGHRLTGVRVQDDLRDYLKV